MIGKVAIAAALRGLNDRTFGDPFIFFQKKIIFTVTYTLSKHKQKTKREKLKKQIYPWGIESCPFATASRVKRWSLNSNLFFKEPHQFTKFS